MLQRCGPAPDEEEQQTARQKRAEKRKRQKSPVEEKERKASAKRYPTRPGLVDTATNVQPTSCVRCGNNKWSPLDPTFACKRHHACPRHSIGFLILKRVQKAFVKQGTVKIPDAEPLVKEIAKHPIEEVVAMITSIKTCPICSKPGAMKVTVKDEVQKYIDLWEKHKPGSVDDIVEQIINQFCPEEQADAAADKPPAEVLSGSSDSETESERAKVKKQKGESSKVISTGKVQQTDETLKYFQPIDPRTEKTLTESAKQQNPRKSR